MLRWLLTRVYYVVCLGVKEKIDEPTSASGSEKDLRIRIPHAVYCGSCEDFKILIKPATPDAWTCGHCSN